MAVLGSLPPPCSPYGTGENEMIEEVVLVYVIKVVEGSVMVVDEGTPELGEPDDDEALELGVG